MYLHVPPTQQMPFSIQHPESAFAEFLQVPEDLVTYDNSQIAVRHMRTKEQVWRSVNTSYTSGLVLHVVAVGNTFDFVVSYLQAMRRQM